MSKPKAFLLPLAIVLSAVNLGAVWFAVGPGESPWHATIHAALAVGCALWAERLWRRTARGGGDLQMRLEESEAFRALEGEVSTLREALLDSQARLEESERVRR